jgi:hypothetical protein
VGGMAAPLENPLHISIVDYLDETPLLFTSSKTGANVGKRLGAIYKRMGVRKGWPDIQICEKGARGELGLFVELKSKGHSLRPYQRAVRDQLRAKGYVCEEAKTLTRFKSVLDRYLSGEGEPFECTLLAAEAEADQSSASTMLPQSASAPRQRASALPNGAGSSVDPVDLFASSDSE